MSACVRVKSANPVRFSIKICVVVFVPSMRSALVGLIGMTRFVNVVVVMQNRVNLVVKTKLFLMKQPALVNARREMTSRLAGHRRVLMREVVSVSVKMLRI